VNDRGRDRHANTDRARSTLWRDDAAGRCGAAPHPGDDRSALGIGVKRLMAANEQYATFAPAGASTNGFVERAVGCVTDVRDPQLGPDRVGGDRAPERRHLAQTSCQRRTQPRRRSCGLRTSRAWKKTLGANLVPPAHRPPARTPPAHRSPARRPPAHRPPARRPPRVHLHSSTAAGPRNQTARYLVLSLGIDILVR